MTNILRAGLKVAKERGEVLEPRDLALIECVAAMLQEATKPRKRESSVTKEHKDLGQKVFGYLKQELYPHWMAKEHTYAQLGKELQANKVGMAEVITFARWASRGGLDWMNCDPTWGQFCKFALDWIGRALSAGEPQRQASALDEMRERGEL